MNFIEHLWFLLKEKVYKVDPHIELTGGSKVMKEEHLWNALFKAWELIDDSILQSLIESMPRRVAAVVKAEG